MIGFELAPPGPYPRIEVTGTDLVTTYVMDDGNICREHIDLGLGQTSAFWIASRVVEHSKDNTPKSRMTSAYVDARTIHHTLPSSP